MDETRDICEHEAAHVAAAVFHRRAVEWVEWLPGGALAGETMGRCQVPVRGIVEPSQVVIALVGYLSVDASRWPPPWPDALDEPREGLGTVLTVLGVDEEQYRGFIELTRELLESEHFRRLRDGIARALARVPRLENQDIEALCKAHGVPTTPLED